MPTINKKKNTYPSSYEKSDKVALRKKLYNNTKYRKIRDWYMMEHPLCEDCLKEGKVTPSTELHHILSPFDDGLTWETRYQRLYGMYSEIDGTYMNFAAICDYHHQCRHNNIKKGS